MTGIHWEYRNGMQNVVLMQIANWKKALHDVVSAELSLQSGGVSQILIRLASPLVRSQIKIDAI